MLKARCKFGPTWMHARASHTPSSSRVEESVYIYIYVCVADIYLYIYIYTGRYTDDTGGEGRQGRYLALMIAIMPNAISRQNLSVARATARVANRAKNSNELPERARKSGIMRGRARTMKREGNVGEWRVINVEKWNREEERRRERERVGTRIGMCTGAKR